MAELVGTQRLERLRRAARGHLAFGDTPPSGGKKFPPSKKYQTWNNQKKRWETSSSPPPCAEQILPLTASKATVKAKIDALSTGGTTRIDIGAGWGWRVLSERWQGVWGTAGLPLDDEARPRPPRPSSS